jgi:aspartate 1-decarboxylase
MMREVLFAKIHRATVTEANVDYVGSITIDSLLLEASGIREYDKVLVVDIDNGARLETYVIKGEPGSGHICMNGAAARLIRPGDLVIIIAFRLISEGEEIQPKLVFVDKMNRIANNLEGGSK